MKTTYVTAGSGRHTRQVMVVSKTRKPYRPQTHVLADKVFKKAG